MTRYLSAAAYLDSAFCHRAIRELVEDDPYRAVVPSYGFDVSVVLAHCLRARRLRLMWDLAITGGFIMMFVLSPPAAASYLPWAIVLRVVPRIPWRRMSWWERIRTTGVGLFVFWAIQLLLASILVALFLVIYALSAVRNSGGVGDIGGGPAALWLNPLVVLMVPPVTFLGMFALAFGYRVHAYSILRRELPPNAPTVRPVHADPYERRLRQLGVAQHGNITLYSGYNPFVGSGPPQSPWARSWSITLELDRPAAADATPGRVDPVELHEHVRRGLMAMAEEWPFDAEGKPDTSGPSRGLPINERVEGLSIGYHVVARGLCHQYPRIADPRRGPEPYSHHPLIDRTGTPFARADRQAREAIIRHPQANLRCYQRVTVSGAGKAVRMPDGELVAPAEASDIMVSVFIHLAVEGNMLHAQFIADVLPPVRAEFRIVDQLPACAGLPLVALRKRWLATLSEGTVAPFRAIRTIAGLVVAHVRSHPNPVDFTVHDYGARLSVRELAADDGMATMTEELDAHKYSRLIERRMNESVLDYLQRRDIDVSAYRQQMSAVVEQGVLVAYGNITGGQFAVGVSGGQVNQSSGK